MDKAEKPEKTLVAWKVTPEEKELIEKLKIALMRPTTADLLRYLVVAEAKKILAQPSPTGTN